MKDGIPVSLAQKSLAQIHSKLGQLQKERKTAKVCGRTNDLRTSLTEVSCTHHTINHFVCYLNLLLVSDPAYQAVTMSQLFLI